MQEYDVTNEELDEIDIEDIDQEELEEWLDSLEDEEWEGAIDSLSEEQFEAYQTKHLYRELKNRYYWDIFKLVFLVAYPTIWIMLYLFRGSLPTSLPEWIPSSINSLWTTFLQDVPAIGSIVIAIFMVLLQFRNLKHFRDYVIPLADEIRERKIAALE